MCLRIFYCILMINPFILGCSQKPKHLSNIQTQCQDTASLSLNRIKVKYTNQIFKNISSDGQYEKFELKLMNNNELMYYSKFTCEYLSNGEVSLTERRIPLK